MFHNTLFSPILNKPQVKSFRNLDLNWKKKLWENWKV
jgi:hypothetical protein